jgi:hypothetical protein
MKEKTEGVGYLEKLNLYHLTIITSSDLSLNPSPSQGEGSSLTKDDVTK